MAQEIITLKLQSTQTPSISIIKINLTRLDFR